jgi:hypothetical protein
VSAKAAAKAKRGGSARRDRNGLTRCRVCGCTQVDGCNPPCGWIAGEDMCTTCWDAVQAVFTWTNSARRVNWAGLRREAEKIIPF